MIISYDQSPSHSVYYIGSIILSIVSERKIHQVDLLELHRQVQSKSNVSLNLMINALEFLYIIGIVKDLEGKCICFLNT